MRCVWCAVGLAVGSAHLAHLTRCPHPSPPSCCWTPTPSVEWTRWSSRWHRRASRRPRKGRPTTLPPSFHPHHPILPPCKAIHTCLGSTGWGCTPPPLSHTRPTAHLSCPKTLGEGPGLSLAPPLTVWLANTGLHPHKPMPVTILTMLFPDPPCTRKMAENPVTDTAGRGYWHRCEWIDRGSEWCASWAGGAPGCCLGLCCGVSTRP